MSADIASPNNDVPYRLIGSPASRAFRIVWLLEELGVPYEITIARPHSEEILALNPSGKIPALLVYEPGTGASEAGETAALLDSVAICQFLADRHRRFTATAGSVQRGLQDSLLHFACDELDSNLWVAMKHNFALPEHLRAEAPVRAAVEFELERSFALLRERIGDNPYCAGAELTVPDIVIGHCCRWALASGFADQVGSVGDYFERVSSRAAFQKAVEIRDSATK